METYLNENSTPDTKVAIEYITPAQANEYISNNYHYNRKVADRKVKELATEMRMGRFYLGDSAICFNKDDALINGQHRLNAVIKSNCYICITRLDNVKRFNSLIIIWSYMVYR